MAGGSGSGTGSGPATPASSRAATTRSAVKKAAAMEASTMTPTRKGKQKSLAALARSSAGSSHKHASAIPPSPLHPSLPRPPSWQQSLAAQLDSENMSPRRKSRKRTSVDERDPGDSVDSTEDEMELDLDDTLLLLPAASSSKAIAVNNSHVTNNSDEKQNICVCVRIRPSAPGAAEEEAPIWELDEQAGRIALSENHPIMEKRKNVSEDAYDFSFDSLLLPPNPTSAMYEGRISQVVLAAMEGYNGTIFSYGQTGSGKTHTMTGSDEEPGILPLAISDIFHRISTDNEREYLLRVSYLEIYNETLKDLLAPVKQKNLELRLTEDNRGRIVVNNIKEEIVNSPQDVLQVLTKGEDNRSVNCTDWNQRSSRSHCVFSMIIESRPRVSDTTDDAFTVPTSSASSSNSKKKPGKLEVRISQLNLIDLAGSERATSQEERRKEGAFINKSLLSLSNVIHKLADDKSNGAHIPYRDSKLTRLLQTSLSGNARITIVCTISPEARHGTESVSTLKFAQRASKIVTKAECGVVTDGSGALLASLHETIANLQAQLAKESSAAVIDGALESEKQARQKAEEEAREQRMKVIQLTDQISHLQRQILTGTAEIQDDSSSVPRTPSISKRHYGELGTGSRPTGQRGSNRRLSELAFGLASPARHSGLPASTSMRSISSALETIHSPRLAADDDRIKQLETELAGVTSAAAEEHETLRTKMEEMEVRNDKLTAELASAKVELNTSRQKLRQLDQQVEETTMTVSILREEVVACHETEDRIKKEHQTYLTAVQAEVLELQKTLEERDGQITALKQGNVALSSETSTTLTTLQGKLAEVNASLQTSEAENQNLKTIVKSYEDREARQKVELLNITQKLILFEGTVDERDAKIKTMHEKIYDLEDCLKTAQSSAEIKYKDFKAEIVTLKGHITQMERDHAMEAAELDVEYREEVRKLQVSLRQAEDAVEQHRAAACLHEQTISTLRADLEKKEQARIRLAQLKAANAPPDFSAIQAKMQAVSGRSASKSLNNSLTSSQGSQQHVSSASESDAALASLKGELNATKSKLRDVDHTLSNKDSHIRELEQRILDLESSIATFRQQIDKNQALLDELDGNDGLIQKLQTMSVRSTTPEAPNPRASAKSVLPLGAMSPHRATTSAHRPAGLLTPTKSASHGYTLHAKPPPLPLPPGTPEWRRQRRETREHEMNLLRSGGIASRTRTYLQSPRLEKSSLDWNSRSPFDSENTENSPMRVKKSSAGSVRSPY